MLALRRPLAIARLIGDRRSTAALEFALILPILTVLFFGMYDTAEGMLTYEQVFTAARTIAASASNQSVLSSTGGTELFYGQVQEQASAIFAMMPTVRSGFHTGLKSITISSVNFEVKTTNPACTPGTNCFYYAYVVWSVAYAGPTGVTLPDTLTPALRTCATETAGALNTSSALSQVGPTSGTSSNLGQLRTSAITQPAPFAASPDPIVVVDIHYQFTPLFNLFIHAPIDFWANGYWPLRSVQPSQQNANGTFSPLSSDQQYTGLVSTGTTSNGVTTGPWTIKSTNVYPTGYALAATAGTPPTTEYCISNYYTEPSS